METNKRVMQTAQDNDKPVHLHKRFLFPVLEVNFFFSKRTCWLVLVETNWFACIGQEGRVYPRAGRMESHTAHPSD